MASVSGPNPLDPSSDDNDDDRNNAAGNGASMGQPFIEDDASQVWDGTTQCQSQSSDDEGMLLNSMLVAEMQVETQVPDDYDCAAEQAGIEADELEVTAQGERLNAGFMPPIEQAVASHVPLARQLLPHAKKVKRGRGPVECALLSDPASPSAQGGWGEVGGRSPQASPEAEAEPPASPSYSPQASPESPSYSPQASP